MDDTLRSCREFTEVLASDAPAPGGGGAAGAPLNERCLALLHRGETAADAVFAQVKHDLL